VPEADIRVRQGFVRAGLGAFTGGRSAMAGMMERSWVVAKNTSVATNSLINSLSRLLHHTFPLLAYKADFSRLNFNVRFRG
jgi:hypothetical protein